MRDAGYAGIYRHWYSTEGNNPFRHRKRRNEREVATALVMWAEWHPEAQDVDTVSCTYADLRNATFLSNGVIKRALDWLQSRGLIEILERARKGTVVRISEHVSPYVYQRKSKGPKLADDQKSGNRNDQSSEDTKSEQTTDEAEEAQTSQEETEEGKSEQIQAAEGFSGTNPLLKTERNLYAKAQSTVSKVSARFYLKPKGKGQKGGVLPKTESHTPKSGTNQEQSEQTVSIENHCDNDRTKNASEKYRNTDENIGTKVEQKKSTTSSENHSENQISEQSSEQKSERKSEVLKLSSFGRLRREEVSASVSFRTKKKAADRKADDQGEHCSEPSEAMRTPEEETKLWKMAERYLEGLNQIDGIPGRKLNRKRLKDDLDRVAGYYGWSLDTLERVIEFRFSHKFWGKVSRHPWTLTKPLGNSDDPWAEIYKQSQEAMPKEPKIVRTVDEDGTVRINGYRVFQSMEEG